MTPLTWQEMRDALTAKYPDAQCITTNRGHNQAIFSQQESYMGGGIMCSGYCINPSQAWESAYNLEFPSVPVAAPPMCWRCDVDKIEREAVGHSTVGTPFPLCMPHFQLAMIAGWKPVLYANEPNPATVAAQEGEPQEPFCKHCRGLIEKVESGVWIHVRSGMMVCPAPNTQAEPAAVHGAEEGGAALPVEGAAKETKRKKGIYIGAPACFALEQCCQHINEAFGDYGCFIVGSALERQDWRDVDVRFIMEDEKFYQQFPDAERGHWKHDAKWLLLTIGIAGWMSKQTGLPIDFQIQPQDHANEHHKGLRSACGLKIHRQVPASKPEPSTPSDFGHTHCEEPTCGADKGHTGPHTPSVNAEASTIPVAPKDEKFACIYCGKHITMAQIHTHDCTVLDSPLSVPSVAASPQEGTLPPLDEIVTVEERALWRQYINNFRNGISTVYSSASLKAIGRENFSRLMYCLDARERQLRAQSLALAAAKDALIHADAILSRCPDISTNCGGKGPSTSTSHARTKVAAALRVQEKEGKDANS